MTGREWIARFAAAIGAADPSDEEYERVLELAAEAAHASERTAAPVACWLAAAAGVPLDQALRAAAEVTRRP
jgi:Domain of unknown function (DUF6457)